MAQVLTVVATCVLVSYLLWKYGERLFEPKRLQVTVRLDRAEPGAHLIRDIINTGNQPVTLAKLIVHGRGGAGDTVPLGLPKIFSPARPTWRSAT